MLYAMSAKPKIIITTPSSLGMWAEMKGMERAIHDLWVYNNQHYQLFDVAQLFMNDVLKIKKKSKVVIQEG
jgi:hypothetical protein